MNIIQALAILGTSSTHYTEAAQRREAEAVIETEKKRDREMREKDQASGIKTSEPESVESLRGITVKQITAKSLDGQEVTGWTLIHDNTGLRMLAPARQDSDWAFSSKARAEAFRREVLRLGKWNEWQAEDDVPDMVMNQLERLSADWYLGNEARNARIAF